MHDRDAYREDREAELGYAEVSERELRLRDWESTRTDANFDALVNRLRASRWVRQVRAEGGWRLERLRRNGREYQARKRAADPQGWRTAENERRRAQRRKTPIVCRCVECGATWCRVVWVRGPAPSTCGPNCQARYAYHRRQLAAGRVSRRTGHVAALGGGLGLVTGGGVSPTNAAATVRERLLRELARREWLRCVEARELCAEIHRSTYCQVIQQLRRAGAIVSEGRGVQARYRLAARNRKGDGR